MCRPHILLLEESGEDPCRVIVGSISFQDGARRFQQLKLVNDSLQEERVRRELTYRATCCVNI
jgi:hypothetical protein